MFCLSRLFAFVAVCSVATQTFAQISFARQQYSAENVSAVYASADLNGDGATDLLMSQQLGAGNTNGFAVYLSNGDGTFQRPVPYPGMKDGPSRGIVTGDFNHDGKTDIVAADGSGFLVYLGDGDGTLPSPTHYQLNYSPLMAVADVNHDNNADLLLSYHDGIYLSLGKGNGEFKVPVLVYSPPSYTGSIAAGDFDGDGNIDLEINGSYTTKDEEPVTTLTVLYGNGKGVFAPVVYSNIPEYLFLSAADVNQDGRTDLIGGFDCAASGCGNGVQVYYGNSNRTLTAVNYPAKGIAYLNSRGAVADFNGDGRLDVSLAYTDQQGNSGIAVFRRSARGDYAGKTLTPLFGSEDYTASLVVGDFTKDRKPDLSTAEQFSGSLQVLDNMTTSGHFPTCAPPKVSGIQVCSPIAGKTIASPVSFNIAGTSFQPIRKVEIWIDGKKLSETYFAWQLFAFSHPSLSLPSGPHHADVYAGNWDGQLQHTAFDFRVK